MAEFLAELDPDDGHVYVRSADPRFDIPADLYQELRDRYGAQSVAGRRGLLRLTRQKAALWTEQQQARGEHEVRTGRREPRGFDRGAVTSAAPPPQCETCTAPYPRGSVPREGAACVSGRGEPHPLRLVQPLAGGALPGKRREPRRDSGPVNLAELLREARRATRGPEPPAEPSQP